MKHPASGQPKPKRNPLKATDNVLIDHARKAFAKVDGIGEVRMFGGVGFMLNGNLTLAASKRGLLVRVGAAARDNALTRPGTRPMEMRGKPLADYIRVAPDAVDAASMAKWVAIAVKFVRTLPAKKGR